MRRVALGVGVIWTFGACSLSTSLNGLSGGAVDGGADSSIDSSAQGPVDAQAAPIVDAAGADGPVDAGSDAPVGPFCESQHPPSFFCVDFDEGKLSTVYQAGAVTVIPSPTISTGCTGSVGTPARSAPGAFIADFPAAAGSGNAYVRYDQPRGATANGESLQFDMQLLAYTAGQEIDFASLTFTGSDTDPKVRVYVDVTVSGKGELAADNGTSYKYGAFDFPTDGQWHTYRLDVDVSPSFESRVLIDSVPVANATHTATFAATPTASFYLGPAVVAPSAAVRLAMDNAFVTLR
jgi:hypothetical protein